MFCHVGDVALTSGYIGSDWPPSPNPFPVSVTDLLPHWCINPLSDGWWWHSEPHSQIIIWLGFKIFPRCVSPTLAPGSFKFGGVFPGTSHVRPVSSSLECWCSQCRKKDDALLSLKQHKDLLIHSSQKAVKLFSSVTLCGFASPDWPTAGLFGWRDGGAGESPPGTSSTWLY